MILKFIIELVACHETYTSACGFELGTFRFLGSGLTTVLLRRCELELEKSSHDLMQNSEVGVKSLPTVNHEFFSGPQLHDYCEELAIDEIKIYLKFKSACNPWLYSSFLTINLRPNVISLYFHPFLVSDETLVGNFY